jgi:hypothetical protein
MFTTVAMALKADALARRKPETLHQIALARGDGFVPSPGSKNARLGYGFHRKLIIKS